MAFNFKLPGLGGSKTPGPEDQTISAPTVMESGGATKQPGQALAFLNQYSVNKQLQILGGALLFVIILLGALIYHDNRESNYGTAYVAASGEMRMLSQRLAKASSLATPAGRRPSRQQRCAAGDKDAGPEKPGSIHRHYRRE